MKIECPCCAKEIDVTDKLPPNACDSEEISCDCGAEIEIGWYATAEVRGVKPPDKDEENHATAT